MTHKRETEIERNTKTEKYTELKRYTMLKRYSKTERCTLNQERYTEARGTPRQRCTETESYAKTEG